jgi:hypothetical protein
VAALLMTMTHPLRVLLACAIRIQCISQSDR